MFWGLPELQFYPWRALAFEQVLNGYIPLWNSYNGLGTPLFANYQSALMYPFTWIIFLFYLIGKLPAMVSGHMIVNVIHLMIAGMGMVKVCENRKISWAGAAIAGLCFSMGGYLVARFGFFSMVWTAAWFPWVFYYTNRIFDDIRDGRDKFKLAGFIALMFLAGHAQLSWYILLYCGIWVLFQIKPPYRAWLKNVFRFTAAGISAIGLFAIQLLPTAEYLLHSQRGSEVNFDSAMTYSFWPWHFLNFLNPNFFGQPINGTYWGYAASWEDAVYFGLLPLFLALGSILLMANIKKHQNIKIKEWLFLWIMVLLAILFSLGKNSPIFPWLYRTIPTFDMFNAPARYMIWLVFSASILAAYAFDQWKKPQKKVLYWVRLGTASGFGVAIGATWMLFGAQTIKPTLIQAALQISVLVFLSGVLYLLNPRLDAENANGKKPFLWSAGVIVFVAADLLAMNWGTIPVQKVTDIDLLQENPFDQNIRIYMSEAEDYRLRYDYVLQFEDYKDTLSFKRLAQARLANINIFFHTTSMNNFEPMRLNAYDEFIQALNQLSVENQESILARYGIDTLLAFTGQEINQINISAAEPIRFYSDYQIANTMGDYLLNASTSKCFFIMGDDSIINDIQPEKKGQGCTAQAFRIENLFREGNKIKFDATTDSDGWIVISDTYDTGWKAYVDGKSVTVYRADGFIKAIPIHQGQHSVELIYLPTTFLVGAIISLVSLLLLGILYYMAHRNHSIYGSKS